jgi:hypothetical protein
LPSLCQCVEKDAYFLPLLPVLFSIVRSPAERDQPFQSSHSLLVTGQPCSCPVAACCVCGGYQEEAAHTVLASAAWSPVWAAGDNDRRHIRTKVRRKHLHCRAARQQSSRSILCSRTNGTNRRACVAERGSSKKGRTASIFRLQDKRRHGFHQPSTFPCHIIPPSAGTSCNSGLANCTPTSCVYSACPPSPWLDYRALCKAVVPSSRHQPFFLPFLFFRPIFLGSCIARRFCLWSTFTSIRRRQKVAATLRARHTAILSRLFAE